MPKLLIVDDEADVREFAKRFFTKRNIDVTTAAGGQEALEIIGRDKPDLVLLDVRMEEMTGVEVLRELRGKQDNTKVIMVSGVNDHEIIAAANAYGVHEFIHKPLVLEELEKIVLAELAK
ncbi:MAG: response regulator [Candidatus Omnitrophica bacterium]|nr:response regulator [Candidatus Omnitrophota bacterium]